MPNRHDGQGHTILRTQKNQQRLSRAQARKRSASQWHLACKNTFSSQHERLHKLSTELTDDSRSTVSDESFQSHDSMHENKESIVRPYKSKKVRLNLIPCYASATCGPANARHHTDGESYLQPNLWYNGKQLHSNQLRALEMVKKDRHVRKYTACVSRFLREEHMKCGHQRQQIRYVLWGLDKGYRGLELWHNNCARCIQRKYYVCRVVQFTKRISEKGHAATKGNGSFLEKLCAYSRMFTHSDCAEAWRMAQVDAIAAQS